MLPFFNSEKEKYSKFNSMKQFYLLVIFALFLFSEASLSQTNLLGDPFLRNGHSSAGIYEEGKWTHSFNTAVVTGKMGRIANPDFADSLMYCRASYKVATTDNRENCCFSQKITGLKPNKYRFDVNLQQNVYRFSKKTV